MSGTPPSWAARPPGRPVPRLRRCGSPRGLRVRTARRRPPGKESSGPARGPPCELSWDSLCRIRVTPPASRCYAREKRVNTGLPRSRSDQEAVELAVLDPEHQGPYLVAGVDERRPVGIAGVPDGHAAVGKLGQLHA